MVCPQGCLCDETATERVSRAGWAPPWHKHLFALIFAAPSASPPPPAPPWLLPLASPFRLEFLKTPTLWRLRRWEVWTDPQGWRPHLLFLHQNFSQRELPDPQVPPSAQWERGFQITWFGERLHCLLEIDRVQEGSKSTEKLCRKMNPHPTPMTVLAAYAGSQTRDRI